MLMPSVACPGEPLVGHDILLAHRTDGVEASFCGEMKCIDIIGPAGKGLPAERAASNFPVPFHCMSENRSRERSECLTRRGAMLH